MIELITWKEIYNIWANELWLNRHSRIEPNSAMCFLEGFDMENMRTNPTFFGYIKDGKIVGVNSGHKCIDNSYRSRGLWVDTEYRKQGIGKALLIKTVEQGKLEQCDFVWSFPRLTSWHAYSAAGFKLASNWGKSETSDHNAYCIKQLKVLG